METIDRFPYYKIQERLLSIADMKLNVAAKPGIPHWDKVSTVDQLLANIIQTKIKKPVLLMGCGNGALGAVFAYIWGVEGIRLVEPSWAMLRVAKSTLILNGFSRLPVDPLEFPLPSNAYASIVMILPKGRKLARRWLVEAWCGLQPRGVLFLGGANAEGIQSVLKDAEALFGNATVLAYRKGCRVARMVKPGDRATESFPEPRPAWMDDPGIARGSWIEFPAFTCGQTFRLRSLPGVFSSDQVDEGTAMLLQCLSPEQVHGRRVLDFGCGYGLLGLVAARFGAAWVDLLDVDVSAILSARDNLARHSVTNARVLPSDVLDAIQAERYDLILSNPPFHTGKAVSYDIAHTFIMHSKEILTPTGRLILVANRFIRYDRLMMDVYGNVITLLETGKFHVLESGL